VTHFATLVLVPQGTSEIESKVAELLAPYDENDEWGRDGSRWDWWVIGGRFTGMLDGYKPWEDEANYEPCRFCEGTGTTTRAVADQYPAYEPHVGKPCIQCNQKDAPFPGKVMRFAGHGFGHGGDITPARNIDVDTIRFVPGSVVTPDGEWHEQGRVGMFASVLPNEKGEEPKEADEWRREFSGLLEANRDAIAVVVDCHV
jgi:hypothetical protein